MDNYGYIFGKFECAWSTEPFEFITFGVYEYPTLVQIKDGNTVIHFIRKIGDHGKTHNLLQWIPVGQMFEDYDSVLATVEDDLDRVWNLVCLNDYESDEPEINSFEYVKVKEALNYVN